MFALKLAKHHRKSEFRCRSLGRIEGFLRISQRRGGQADLGRTISQLPRVNLNAALLMWHRTTRGYQPVGVLELRSHEHRVDGRNRSHCLHERLCRTSEWQNSFMQDNVALTCCGVLEHDVAILSCAYMKRGHVGSGLMKLLAEARRRRT